ncbi:MAG: phosphopantothenoylcysteine decarboxylase, partial [Nitrospinaceae bacterium]
IDPVRYITNPSSGKMGYAVAQRARARGAEVTLISGPTQLDPPAGVTLLPCQRADEMHRLVLENLPVCDVLVMTAAVGDFAPASVHKEKIKKRGAAPLVLELVPTPDILKDAAAHPDRPYLVGFAAETENLEQSALEKWRGKGLDLVLANDISAPGIGFQSDQNQVLLIAGPDSIEPWPRMSKRDIADRLLDRIREGLARNQALS